MFLRFVFLAAWFGVTADAVLAETPAVSPLVWEAHDKTNTTQIGDITTRFTYHVKNISGSEVIINDLKSSCGCTVAQIPSKPWRLAAGESSQFEVLVDLRNKPVGKFFKEIDILSGQAPDKLLVTVDVQPGVERMSKAEGDRIWGQALAATDHQAVFKQDCVKCHLVPAFGKTGQPLYQVMCGICHDAEHRATVVPDLHALKTEIDTTYWRNWVTHGKAGTLMPGFAATEGGPLTDAQINSLVDFLLKSFPRPIRAANAPHEETKD